MLTTFFNCKPRGLTVKKVVNKGPNDLTHFEGAAENFRVDSGRPGSGPALRRDHVGQKSGYLAADNPNVRSPHHEDMQEARRAALGWKFF